jgi:uncharacterized protein YgiM (DUF1202 family)
LRSLATRQSEVIAQFPGGTELVVEARHAGFVLVRAGSQMRGWLPEDGVFVIGEPLGEPAMN